MSAALLLGLALPSATAALLVRVLWSRRVALPATLVASLALGLGVGLSACTYWVALLIGGNSRPLVIGFDAVLLLAAGATWWRRRSGAPMETSGLEGFSGSDLAMLAVVLTAALAALTAFTLIALDNPHGEWDAWAIWNARARFLFRAGAGWRQAFSTQLMHADYPPLLPSAVAHAWVWSATDTIAAPIAIALIFAVALVLLLVGATAALRSRTLALLGAACVLGTPVLLQRAAWQYADTPLAFFLLATVALLAAADRAGDAAGEGVLALAGAAAGLAACTKNEGVLFLLAIAMARGTSVVRARDFSPWRLAAFLLGLAPPALILAHFKLALAPPSYLFADQDAAAYLARLVEPARYVTIGAAFAAELARSLGLLALALPLAALLLGSTGERAARQSAAWIGAAVGLIALGYGVVYLVTPLDLDWQLNHSLDRLVLHLWPTALFALLLVTASPEEWRARAEAAAASPPRRSSGGAAGRRAGRRRLD